MRFDSHSSTHGKRVFVGEWSGPAHWQVRGPLPACVTDKGEPATPEATEFIEAALVATTRESEPVTFGESYQCWVEHDPCQWRRQAGLLVADAVMVEMIEHHCGKGEWRCVENPCYDNPRNPRSMFVYEVDGEPQAFLATRAPDRHDKAERERKAVAS